MTPPKVVHNPSGVRDRRLTTTGLEKLKPSTLQKNAEKKA